MAKIEVMGVKLDIDATALDDIDVIECIADLNSPDADGAGQAAATVKLLRTVFGSDYQRIKAELRERNGGRLTVETMGDFFTGVSDALGKAAKN